MRLIIKSILLGTITFAQSGIISGFISDSSSGEALIGANVMLKENGKGMATDQNGYYVIQSVDQGEYTLLVSYVGFELVSEPIKISIGQSLKVDISLKEQVVELSGVEITAERIKRRNNLQPSKINLSPRMLKSAPALAEPDLFRTIQALPGVLTTSEFSTGLVIRGGNTDQNLILLDGVTVYNPSHLGGVFSNFIVDGVKEAELIKGAYNSEYGGRLSAVLNILSREGNQKEFEGKANVSLLSAQTTMEGPFYKGAWVLSGRRTYFDVVLPKSLRVPPYYFYDLQGHIFSDTSPRNRFSASYYNGVDDLLYDTFGIEGRWGNNTVSGKWRRVISERWIGNALISKSLFFTDFGLGGSNGFITNNLIDDITVAANLSWFYSPNVTVKLGAQYKDLGFLYDNYFQDSLYFRIDTETSEFSSYAKLKYPVSENFIVEPGIRVNYYSVFNDSIYPDLRLGMKFLLTDNRYLNFSVGNYHQFIFTFQDDYNPNILDQWIAVDETLVPGKSVQYVIGYEEYIKDKFKIQVESYYKDLKNLYTYEEQNATQDAPPPSDNLSEIVTPSNGFAYGIEFFAQKMKGRMNGWLAYTYSVSRKKMNSIFYDFEEEYFNAWDRRHSFSTIGNYIINTKLDMNWKLSLQSGQAYTPIIGYYNQTIPGISDSFESFTTIPGKRNSGRYKPYSRLDMGLVYHTKLFGAKMDIYLQVINIYNRKNTFRKTYSLGSSFNGVDDDGDWDKDLHDSNGNGEPDVGETNVDEDDESRLQINDISLFPIIPTIGFSWEF